MVGIAAVVQACHASCLATGVHDGQVSSVFEKLGVGGNTHSVLDSSPSRPMCISSRNFAK
jgi:hypothetical protein